MNILYFVHHFVANPVPTFWRCEASYQSGMVKPMASKKRVNVMLHERLTQRVIELAKVLDSSPNDFVNRVVEGALAQIDDRKKPTKPIPIVNLARTVLRKNLGYGDRLLQSFLEARVSGWGDRTEDWRDTYLRLANDVDGELTNDELERLKPLADEICAAKNG